MRDFRGRTAVITGAGSGFGRAFARLAGQLGMRLMLADVEAPALEATLAELRGAGAEVAGEQVDVSRGEEVERLADHTYERFGAVHLLFNNAGVGLGGYVWEHGIADWEWVLGVNLWGVIHGVRCFVPRMLRQDEPSHVVNTASVAGLISPPMMGAYNVSKHGVVTLTETLYHDLRLAGARIGVSLLCPAYVNTGIAEAARNRPAAAADAPPRTASQELADRGLRQATASGRIDAAAVARLTFDAVRDGRFYVLTHPRILPAVGLRFADIEQGRAPSDPHSFRKEGGTGEAGG